MLRDLFKRNAEQRNFRLFCPDETNSNRLGDVFEVENRCLVSRIDYHRRSRLARRPGDGSAERALPAGWLEGYSLTGRHGLFATYEAFAMVSASMAIQHTKWLKTCRTELPWRAPIPSLNFLLTSTCWRNDHNGFSHQGPGLIDTMLTKQGIVARIYLPPDANCLLSVADHCLRSRNYVNLIVIDKQPHPQWLDIDAAASIARGASIWQWASNDRRASRTSCSRAPATYDRGDGRGRVAAPQVSPRDEAPGRQRRRSDVAFPARRPSARDGRRRVRRALHPRQARRLRVPRLPGRGPRVLHGRTKPERFHVRGFIEEGTTTTPFDMVVLNGASRYHLCIEALKRAPRYQERARELIAMSEEALDAHRKYVVEHLEDMAAIRDWQWSAT